MTAPTIPRGLRVIAAAQSQGLAAGVDRTEVDGGPARYALAFDRGVQTFNVTMVLNALQFQIWTLFLHRTIAKGAISFEMPLNSGFGLAPHLVNIVPGSYSAVRSGGELFTVSFQVEGESQAYGPSDAEAAALLALYEEAGEDSARLLARLAKFATIDTLVLEP